MQGVSSLFAPQSYGRANSLTTSEQITGLYFLVNPSHRPQFECYLNILDANVALNITDVGGDVESKGSLLNMQNKIICHTTVTAMRSFCQVIWQFQGCHFLFRPNVVKDAVFSSSFHEVFRN